MEQKFVRPLFFENRKGQLSIIAEVENIQEAHQQIHKFCQEHNYTNYYTRMWIESKENAESGTEWSLTFDVGSWSEFFILFFETEEQAREFLDITL